mmetsp:Transcript_16589/g.24802  ORF Transcript_16589/g.24802 Transcript_16589/m.24802 type:complete len:454 (-) Transcript_16589:75-1436(-)|eukprot:CAMPEP_0203664956 /NCGR_PEP_ID=MMETSP0090-20130426/2271_1 /ASSEMBLY_ACC=CAM_ASM_001088 /TAXON_ID=426623 /ORGANISM="Chaetoceros affinis, Strain CCMP159" /LENGTH=453 /DNA_ID=CAMNT_0050528381 /DNA_START=64 /DNA_END=1425 /DNA_ORIENTATION=+
MGQSSSSIKKEQVGKEQSKNTNGTTNNDDGSAISDITDMRSVMEKAPTRAENPPSRQRNRRNHTRTRTRTRTRTISHASYTRNPRNRTASQSSLLFTRNATGYNFIRTSIHSGTAIRTSNRPYFPSPEEERAALEENGSFRSSIPFHKTVEQVYVGVHDGKVLGDGVNGEVRRVTHRETGKMFALKRLNMNNVRSEKQANQLLEEIEIMCQLDHPNIIKLEEVYESEDYIYLVEELCLGGELFDRLDEQPNYHYKEEQCANLILQIVSAVQYLHAQGIVHRDLKLENFLFTKPDSDSDLKMIDFGLSKHLKYGEKEKDAVGTPYTVAPEVIRGSYTEKCDVWGIGVIAYLLMSGDPPFGGCAGEPLRQVRNNILKANYRFKPEFIWKNVSEEGKDFIRELLQLDPMKRPSTRELLISSPWLHKFMAEEKEEKPCWLNCSIIRHAANDIFTRQS